MDWSLLHLFRKWILILILTDGIIKIRNLILEIRRWYYSGKTFDYRTNSNKLVHINLAYHLIGKIGLKHNAAFYFLLLFIILFKHLKALIIHELIIINIDYFIFHQIFNIGIKFCSWTWPWTAVASIRAIGIQVDILSGWIQTAKGSKLLNVVQLLIRRASWLF